MKKSHMILLIVATIISVFSVYSLASINLVHKVIYERYCEIENRYISDQEQPDVKKVKWPNLHGKFEFSVKSTESEQLQYFTQIKDNGKIIQEQKDGEFIYIDSYFENPYETNLRIRITDIARRGNLVEVKIGFEEVVAGNIKYDSEDSIRIRKTEFLNAGEVHFVFKNQRGFKMHDTTYILN